MPKRTISKNPDGPAAAPRLDDLRFRRNCSQSNENGWSGRAFKMSKGRDSAGQEDVSSRLEVGSKYPECQVPPLLFPEPGVQKKLLLIRPTSELLLHDDSHRLSAVRASVGMRLLNLAQRPACSVSTNAPNLHGRMLGCFQGTLPPRGGRNKIILGRSMNNFHARWTLMKSPFASPKSLSSKATLNAALNAPLRNTGTVRITTARRWNTSRMPTMSRFAPPQWSVPSRRCQRVPALGRTPLLHPRLRTNHLCRPPQQAILWSTNSRSLLLINSSLSSLGVETQVAERNLPWGTSQTRCKETHWMAWLRSSRACCPTPNSRARLIVADLVLPTSVMTWTSAALSSKTVNRFERDTGVGAVPEQKSGPLVDRKKLVPTSRSWIDCGVASADSATNTNLRDGRAGTTTGHPHPKNRSESNVQGLNPHCRLSADDGDLDSPQRQQKNSLGSSSRAPHDAGKNHAREACRHRCPPRPIWETRSSRLQISSNDALVLVD